MFTLAVGVKQLFEAHGCRGALDEEGERYLAVAASWAACNVFAGVTAVVAAVAVACGVGASV